jgi:hypothetical protein
MKLRFEKKASKIDGGYMLINGIKVTFCRVFRRFHTNLRLPPIKS